jgi:hypothetical protein
MARVSCTLPHASSMISGIKFERDSGGMMSEELPLLKAVDMFGGMRGFIVHPSETDKEPAPPPEMKNLKELHGPVGTLGIFGDYSSADLTAMQAHWSKGAIAGPAGQPVPEMKTLLGGPAQTIDEPAVVQKAPEGQEAAGVDEHSEAAKVSPVKPPKRPIAS